VKIALVGAELEENLALRSIHAALERAGHCAQLFSFDEPEQLAATADRIAASAPELVGLSMVFTRRAREFLDLAQALRAKAVRGPIVAGGHFAVLHARELLRDAPQLDFVLAGEGEEALVSLLGSLDDLARVAGLTWRDGPGSVRSNPTCPPPDDLDARAWPTRPQTFERYLGLPIANVLSGRGCWAACRFCSIRAWHEAIGGARFRQRTPESLAEEMASLYHRRGVRLFNFHDDNFFHPRREVNLERFQALQDALAARDVGRIGIQVKARPDSVDAEIVEKLLELGLYRVFLGVESNSVAGLKALGRGIKREQNDRALRTLLRAGVHVAFNLLMFEPDCTLADLADNSAFIRRHAEVPLNFCRTEVYGGTPLQKDLAAQGRLTGDYFGYDYAIAEPAAERAFQVFCRTFWGRNFRLDGVNHRAMAVDFELHILKRFWPHRLGGALTRKAKSFVRAVNVDNADRLERIFEFVKSEHGQSELDAFAQALEADRARVDEGLSACAEGLLREIGSCAGPIDEQPKRWRRARAAAAAAAVAANLAACDNPRATMPSATEYAASPPEDAAPPVQCSFEESARIAADIIRTYGARLRELSVQSGDGDVSQILLHLEFDRSGRVKRAQYRGGAHPDLAAAVEREALKWTLPGLSRASACDLSLKLPEAKYVPPAKPDAGAPQPRPPPPHFSEMIPRPPHYAEMAPAPRPKPDTDPADEK